MPPGCRGGLRKYDHVTPAYDELRWLRLGNKHELEVLIHVYKVINNLYPGWLSHYNKVSDVSRGSTRQENMLHVPKFKIDAGARSLNILGPKMWNTLPKKIKENTNRSKFKKDTISILLNKQ